MQNPLNSAPASRTVLYIFLSGFAVGVFIGWSMHGIIGVIIRILMFAVVVGLIVIAFNFWQKTRQEERDVTIEATWRETGDPKSRR
ncbi:MAG: hypothetical protein R2843_06345 [Thermomicrobiales bacterium]